MSHDHHGGSEQEQESLEMTTGSTEDHSGHGANSGSVHQMYFYSSAKSTILFLEWTTTTWGGLVLACLGIFLAGICYEGLNLFTHKLHTYSIQSRSASKSRKDALSKAVCYHLLQTGLHFLRLIFSYGLMLILMTFNVWLGVAVILGCTLGYFIFRWRQNTQPIESGLDSRIDNDLDNNSDTTKLSTLRQASVAAAEAAEHQFKSDICH